MEKAAAQPRANGARELQQPGRFHCREIKYSRVCHATRGEGCR